MRHPLPRYQLAEDVWSWDMDSTGLHTQRRNWSILRGVEHRSRFTSIARTSSITTRSALTPPLHQMHLLRLILCLKSTPKMVFTAKPSTAESPKSGNQPRDATGEAAGEQVPPVPAPPDNEIPDRLAKEF